MEYLDPIEIEHLASIEKKRRKAANKRTLFVNALFIIVTVITLLSAIFIRKPAQTPFKILMLFIAILIPSLLMKSYPTSFRDDSPVSKRHFLLLRMNPTGAILFSLAFIQYYSVLMGWREAMIISMCICYLLAPMLALRPVFGDGVKPSSIWTAGELVMKSVILAMLALIAGRSWGILFPPDMYMGYKAWAMHVFVPLAGITVFIPFYLGLAVNNIPHADKSRTSGFDNKQLEARFGDENMSGMP